MLQRFQTLAILLLLCIATVTYAKPISPELLARFQSDPVQWAQFQELERQAREAGFEATNRVDFRRNADEPNIVYHALVLLVDFTDHVAQVPASNFDSLMFGTTGSTLRNYLSEISYGAFDLQTYNSPSSIGWIRAPQTYAYYVNGQRGSGQYPQSASRMVEDVVRSVNLQVNYSQYDNDGNTIVDGLFVIHAGTEWQVTGNLNDMGTHASAIPVTVYLDGVRVYNYSTESEFLYSPGDLTIGGFAHEMGHSVFGLPDFYDTDYSSNGLGDWSLMANGSWGGNSGDAPAHPDAFSRIVMGFASPIDVGYGPLNIAIPNIETTPTVYKITPDATQPFEYYLVENRRQVGFDISIPASGLCIYHVDGSIRGNDNEWYPGHIDQGHYEVALEQADNLFSMERRSNSGSTGDVYPGATNNRSFSLLSHPDNIMYSLEYSAVSVTQISDPDTLMHATLFRGSSNESMMLTNMNGGETFAAGTTRTIRWSSANQPYPVNIDIYRSALTGWERILTNIPNVDSVRWVVSGPATTEARIRISSIYDCHTDSSDNSFAITDMVLTAPAGGERWKVGTQQSVTWNSNGVSAPVNIEVNRTYPTGAWETIASNIPNNGSYQWTVAGTATLNARIRVRTADSVHVSVSQQDFKVSEFRITTPNGGESWTVGSRNRIEWATLGYDASVNITIQREPGGQWNPVYSRIANGGGVIWVTSAPATTHARIRITCTDSSVTDSSDAIFSIVQTSAPEAVASIPNHFELSNAYPNPFNSTTTIRYGLPGASKVTVAIYSIDGRLIQTMDCGSEAAGWHTAAIDMKGVAAGVYFYRVATNDGLSATRKFVFVK